ncbi:MULTISPECIES: acyl carrier protein phosphodiesterase [Vibrio]|uniref:DUF479 domain-containing protein n=2 Tax=Vibrio TaxID=662 RepID=A0A7X4LP01_9VIBR|nr:MULTISPECIES: ACP phosphodiesterase [Vibrio]MBF9003063.1 DUF479 domain-containing protein [Vibrio nitrifigilis]MZI95404.1 DUF479 domain-containing protein [Vibrio eleionomae]
MNYLAHLHIAEHCQSNLLGNLLGDFVKGNVQHQYSESIVLGIQLHRRVDAYTDSHHLCRHAKQLFPAHLRRFAPIALDMFWDHCLASGWEHYHALSLHSFINHAEQMIKNEYPDNLPTSFIHVTHKMWSGGWLSSYQELDNVQFALQRIAQRRERIKPLAHCNETLENHYDELHAIFRQFYPELLNAAAKSAKV